MSSIKIRKCYYWLIALAVLGSAFCYIYTRKASTVPTVPDQEAQAQVRSPILWIGPENKGAVALTFDDGPSRYTPQILDVLAKYQAKATFFCLGEQAERNQKMIARAANEGHEIANHTMTHPQAPKVSAEQLQREVGDTNHLLASITGRQVRFFRPPYGYFNVDYFNACEARNLTVVLWTIVPKDWEQPPAKIIAERVLSEIRPGSIVLLHDGGGDRKETVEAVDLILAELAKRNLQAVTLSELLK